MKRAIIGAAFFIGGTILINAEASLVNGEFVLGLFGSAFALAGMAILVYELTVKEKK